MALAGLAAMLGMAGPVDLAALPAPVHAAAVAAAPAPDALIQSFARGHFTVGPARHFTVGRDIPWQMIVKTVETEPPLANKAKRVRYEHQRVGLDLVEVFETGGGRGVAVAMADGSVGYYRVEFPKGERRDYYDPTKPH